MAETMEFLPRSEVLTIEELLRTARLFTELGVRKIRVTGGEPLIRRGVHELFEGLGALAGLDTLALTTNGSHLADSAHALRDAGVRELELQFFGAKLVERFAETLETERDRALARAVVADLESTIAAQIGSRGSAPAGMLDVDRLLRAWVAFEAEKGDRGLCVEAFAMLSRFYRWLGETEQLEPDRARLLASQLSAAALGVAA